MNAIEDLPFSVNPAKFIRKRFSDDKVEFLLFADFKNNLTSNLISVIIFMQNKKKFSTSHLADLDLQG
ncbi:hypothetical protein [Ruminiclostridium cellobioparum]|uniref:hypothetical protein n=1 Tax=Ruminiclostridium cellobioparum TaxID=29355 RepID=UPI0028A8C24F|nr:hypothetical protein [Ruminiclostridium cellobioparum]